MQRRTQDEAWKEYVVRTLREFRSVLSTQGSNIGKVLSTNGSNLIWAVDGGGGGTSLPDQTNNQGKYLTTNGTTASWATVDALPSQSGNSGKYLTTNGVTPSWTSTILTDSKQTITVTSGTRTISFSAGNIVDLTINVPAVTLTFIDASITTYVIKITNNSGALSITWPVNVKWSGGIPPSITQVNGKIDIVTLVYDGTNYYASYMLNF